MRPNEVLYQGSVRLSELAVDQAASQSRLLLAHVLGVTPSQLLTVEDVSDADRQRFDELLDQRAQGVPVQHLTGSASFRYLDLEVGPGVFIPRPETESVAGWAIEVLKGMDWRVVVELCAGSGAISKAIVTEVSRVQAYANEIDKTAFGYLSRNLADTTVRLSRGDMADAFPELDGTVDLVIANPPYIRDADFDTLPLDVRGHDPREALTSGEHGLDAIGVLAGVAARLLRPGGVLVIEHGDDQGESAPGVLLASGKFTDVADHDDLNGRPRFVTAARVDDGPTWRRFDVATEPDAALDAAVEAIRAGECIVLPTDTVYGIGADALAAPAVQRLLNAKHRGRDMPPPVLIAEPAMLAALADSPAPAARALAGACWPGALTLILKAQPGLRMDLGETAGTIALRVPDHEFTRRLLRRTGPLAVSSANVSGQPASTDVADAVGQLGNSVSVYLDAGPTPGDKPSTIVDFVSSEDGQVVRQGALALDDLRRVAPSVRGLPEPGR